MLGSRLAADGHSWATVALLIIAILAWLVLNYGAATLDAVVDYLRTRPGAGVLYTSCADGRGSPRGFYLRYGFADTGRVMWGETVLALDLAARGS